MEKEDHGYERGWKRYRFDDLPFEEKAIHGSKENILIRNVINRGINEAHISFAVIPPTEDAAIGMHMHRDVPTNDDREEWYIVIDGEAVQTFSNGDTLHCRAGDLINIHPGAGHSIRAVNGSCRIISITPKMFTYGHGQADEYPARFNPRIQIKEVDDACCPTLVVCMVCGASWKRPVHDNGSLTLSVWASEHRHGEVEVRE